MSSPRFWVARVGKVLRSAEDGARRYLSGRPGDVELNEINSLTESMISEEAGLLVVRSEAQHSAMAMSNTAIIVGGVVSAPRHERASRLAWLCLRCPVCSSFRLSRYVFEEA